MKPYIGLLSLLTLLVTGCAKSTDTMAAPPGKRSEETVAVNVHGVNYTADPFTYVITDPKNPASRAGGEHIAPFAGGGIMCCFKLPKKWRPGIKVSVWSKHWLAENAKGELPEVEKDQTVDIPPYPNGQVGELWVLRTAAGAIDIVVSDAEPGNPEWPGKVKGWPEPSIAYQRERWELYKNRAETDVRVHTQLLKDVEANDPKLLREAWVTEVQQNPEAAKKFRGPHDVAFAAYLKEFYTEGLEASREKLQQLSKAKP